MYSCFADDIQSRKGCEAACTDLNGCIGYQYPNSATRDRFGCLLVPRIADFNSEATMQICPNGSKAVFTHITIRNLFGPGRGELTEMTAGGYENAYDCYRKTWSKKSINLIIQNIF